MNSLFTKKKTSQKPANWLDRFARKKVHSVFERFSGDPFALNDSQGNTQFGDKSFSTEMPQVDILDHRAYRRMMLGGVIGAAESFMDGQWTSDNLTVLIRAMVRNIESVKTLDSGWAGLSRRLGRISQRLRRNTLSGSKRNIHEHYDLGNEFFALFLDSTMNYSSGIFPSAQATMHDASLNKMDRICRKLRLRPEDHLLEIGTGWGGLAVYAARNYGCRVTTTTISEAQFQLATQRVAQAGLQDHVQVLSKDYRNLAGQYDKLVSVEMIEAVGEQYYGEFFAQCNRLLADDGVMLIQAIVMNENDYPTHLQSVDFIRKYIFPGGTLPSVTALANAARGVSRLRMLHLEDITEHYVRTLQSWRAAFVQELEQVRQQGFSDAFIRKWLFYFCYCEAAFSERRTGSLQLMYARPACRIDPMSALDSGELDGEWAASASSQDGDPGASDPVASSDCQSGSVFSAEKCFRP